MKCVAVFLVGIIAITQISYGKVISKESNTEVFCGDCFSTYYKTIKEQQLRSQHSMLSAISKFNVSNESKFEIPSNKVDKSVLIKGKKEIDSKVYHTFEARGLIKKVYQNQKSRNTKNSFSYVSVFNHYDFLNKSAIESGIITKF